MNDLEWHFYHLIQVEQASPGTQQGGWRLKTDARHAGGGGGEISEWSTDDLRFYRLDDSGRVLVVGVRSDLALEAAAKRMTEHLGIVEVEESNTGTTHTPDSD